MATLYHNINGSDGVNSTLLSAGSVRDIKSINFANTEGAQSGVSLGVFIENASAEKFYLIRYLNIPYGSSFILDDPAMLSYDKDIFSLNITVGSSDTVDVIITV